MGKGEWDQGYDVLKDESRRPRGRPTYASSQALGSAILNVAAALFEEKGFAGVTMTEVAKGARVSKTTLYAQYQSKDMLFRAICSHACRVPAESIGSVITVGRNPEDVLLDFAHAVLDASRDEAADRFLRLAIFEASRFPNLARQVSDETAQIIQPLADWFGQACSICQQEGFSPKILAEQFVALLTGGYRGLLETLDDAAYAQRIQGALLLFRPLLAA